MDFLSAAVKIWMTSWRVKFWSNSTHQNCVRIYIQCAWTRINWLVCWVNLPYSDKYIKLDDHLKWGLQLHPTTSMGLYLQNNLIATIEACVFQGISTLSSPSLSFSIFMIVFNCIVLQGNNGDTPIDLDNNLLTRLDEDVFLDVAQQMCRFPHNIAQVN